MSGWRSKRKTYFSPREVVARNLGPSTIRYQFADRELFEDEKEEEVIDRPSVRRGPVYAPGPGSYRKPVEAWEDEPYYGKEQWWQKPKKEKKQYTFVDTRWANYNFGGFYTQTNSDDNALLFVKDPESYITPSYDEIRTKVSTWETKSVNKIKEYCRLFYLKMIDDRDFHSEHLDKLMNDSSGLSQEQLKHVELLKSLYDIYVPGYTPLEQAIFLYLQERDKESMKNSNRNSSYGNAHPSFDREAFGNPIINEQIMKSQYSTENKLQILNNISIVGKLGAQFVVEKEVGEKVVSNSDKHKKGFMRDYEQMTKIDMYQKFLPNYKARLYSKTLFVDIPVKSSEKIQKIIILLDYSGSMANIEKQCWVNSILIDRFKYVIKGEAEVFFSYFVDTPSNLNFTHIKNEEDVNKFWKTFSNYPGGGQTDMGRIVNYVADEIQKKRKLHNLSVDLSQELPEILIINDGQDRVHGTFKYKVNAISLMSLSTQLKDLCVGTGGKQIYIDPNKKVEGWSSEGKEVIFD